MATPPSEHAAMTKKVLDRHARAQRLHAVADALENAVTGFGTSRSKVAAGSYVDDPILLPEDLEALFANNDLVYTIVTKIVEDALRAGFEIERRDSSEEDYDLKTQILEKLAELKAHDVLLEGATFGRLFGGAGVILGVPNSGPLSSPLRDDVGGLERLEPWDRQDLVPDTYYPDGSVETYTWTRPAIGNQAWRPVIVHESRLLTFPGALTTARRRAMNGSWDLSVMQRVFNVLKSFDSVFASTDSMFADASQAVFKLQGLIESLARGEGTEGTNDVATRLQLMDLLRSSAKAIVLDAGDETGANSEEFTVVDRTSLGSLDGIITQYFIRLAAAARYPLTVLLGMSPAGRNATGESDLLIYFNTVDVFRTKILTPRLVRLVRLIAKGLGDTEPNTWVVKWPELQRPKPLDVKTAEKMAVDSTVALITSGVILPEEAALSLSSIAPTLGITVDSEAREAALGEALKEVAAREMTSPHAEEEPAGAAPAERASERKTPSEAQGQQAT